MSAALSLLVLALPTLLVCAINYVARAVPTAALWASGLVVAGSWCVAIFTSLSYSRQQDDVGLIVHGLLAMAFGAAAVVATLAAIYFASRR